MVIITDYTVSTKEEETHEILKQYKEIETELKDNYQANVDIKMLMRYFIETIFKGEKHERFYILTNEDAHKWDEYNRIDTPDECRTAVENQKEIRNKAIYEIKIC